MFSQEWRISHGLSQNGSAAVNTENRASIVCCFTSVLLHSPAACTRHINKMMTNKRQLAAGWFRLPHSENDCNHRCLTGPVGFKSLPLGGIFTEEASLRSCQWYSRLTCFSPWQQGSNIHWRKTWIKCVAPVKTVTMLSWITRSYGGTGLFNYLKLTAVTWTAFFLFLYFTRALLASEASSYPSWW